MTQPSNQTLRIQGWIDRLQAGDESARDELLNCACERLTRLTRKMLRGYPRVKRWEETGDVVQNASMRLYRSLSEVKPRTAADFFRLAALNIRRELLDLAKHYYGPLGHGAKHASIGKESDSDSKPRLGADKADSLGDDPSKLAAWAEFHRQIELMPDEEREVFDLLWYQGLSQAEAAQVLQVSERTVKRRWQAAQHALSDALHGEVPGE